MNKKIFLPPLPMDAEYQWEYYNNKFVLITGNMGKVAKRKLLAELKRRVEVLS